MPPSETNTNNNNGDDTSTTEVLTTDVSTSDVSNEDSTDDFYIKFFDKRVKVNFNKKIERTVINLFSYDLTETDITVIRKGLKFWPTPGEPVMGQILDDLSGLFWRMRLRAHFNDPEAEATNTDNSQPTIAQSFNASQQLTATDPSHSKFRKKSTFDPNVNNPLLKAFFSLVTQDVNDHTPRNPRKQNLTTQERESLQRLRSNPLITIKKADKGNAIVLMDTTDYIKEAERQLSDQNFYIEKDRNVRHTSRQNSRHIIHNVVQR
jgi:hypothetical protein